jgi:hypothetical protein
MVNGIAYKSVDHSQLCQAIRLASANTDLVQFRTMAVDDR